MKTTCSACPVIVLTIAAVTLVCAIGAQRFRNGGGMILAGEPLAEMMPTPADGWRSIDLPLGATEAQAEVALKLLRFDDYVWVTLEAEDLAPAGAEWVGVELRVQNQIGADWVEARAFILERTAAER